MQGVVGDVEQNLVATGSTQTTATQCSRVHNRVITATADQGVILSRIATPGDSQTVLNDTSVSILVYPPVGESIAEGSVNAGLSLASHAYAEFRKITATEWTVSNDAASSSFAASGSGPTWVSRSVSDKLSERVSLFDNLSTSEKSDVSSYTGATDVATKVQQVLTYCFANNIPCRANPGRYRLDSALAYTGAVRCIQLIGEGEVIFDFTNSTTATALQLGGTAGSSAALDSNIDRNVMILTTGLTLAAGDRILISDSRTWSSENASYTHSEFNEVESVSGTTINLKFPTKDNYVAATTTITKLNMPRVILANTQILRASNHQGLEIIRGADILLENVKVSGARERGIELEQCFGGSVDDCQATDAWFSGTGTSYGLAVTSSQGITVKGGRYYGGRSGVAHGGNNTVRGMTYLGVTVANDRQSNTRAFNFHDNAEYNTVKGCHISGGYSGSVRNLTWEGNTVLSGPSRSCFGGAFVGSHDSVSIRNNKHVVETAGFFACQLTFSENSLTIKNIDLAGNDFSGGGSGFSIDANSKTGLTINRLSIDDVIRTTGTALGVGGSGVDLTISDVEIVGGHYQSNANVSAIIRPKLGSGTLRASGHYENLGAARAFTAYNFNFASLKNYRLTGAGVASANFFQDCLRSDVDGGYHYNWGVDGGLVAVISSTVYNVAAFRNIVLDTVTGVPAVGSGVLLIDHTTPTGKQVAFVSSIPTTGTWHDGDQAWDIVVATGATPGWVCTTEGTFSAATDSTGDTDGSTAVITGMTDTSDFAVGQYVTASAGFASTGPHRILALTSTTMTISASSNSAQSDITVATPDPVLTAMAVLS